jgi:hypothetical protein
MLHGLFPYFQCDDCFIVLPVATLQMSEAQSGVHSPLIAVGVASDLESVYSHFGGCSPQALAADTSKGNETIFPPPLLAQWTNSASLERKSRNNCRRAFDSPSTADSVEHLPQGPLQSQ